MASPAFLTNIKKYTTDLLKYSSPQKTAKPVILILLLYALEQIITTKTFYSCPASGHRTYGALFLFGPGLCFFMLSLLLNKPFLNTVSGCCRSRNFDHARACRSTVKALRRSTFIAFVWFVLAFANTQFYLCFRLGPEPSQDRLKEMDEQEREKSLNKFSEEKIRSTVICWSLFLSAIFLAFFYTMIRTCIFSEAEGTLPSFRKYEKLKEKASTAKFKEQIEIIAKKEGEEQVELYISKAREKGTRMSAIVCETKERLERQYAARRRGDAPQDCPLENMVENGKANGEANGQANGHPAQIMGSYQPVSAEETTSM